MKQLLSLPPWSYFIRLFGYEVKKPSLLGETLNRVTNQSWIESLHNNNRVHEYSYEIYTR